MRLSGFNVVATCSPHDFELAIILSKWSLQHSTALQEDFTCWNPGQRQEKLVNTVKSLNINMLMKTSSESPLPYTMVGYCFNLVNHYHLRETW